MSLSTERWRYAGPITPRRRFDRVEILGRLRVLEQGEMTSFERALVEVARAARDVVQGAVPVGGDDPYDRLGKDGPACEKCGEPKGNTRAESVEGRGPGWKCTRCRWWNWLDTPGKDGAA